MLKFKIRITLLIAKILLKQRILLNSDTVWQDIFKSDIIFFPKRKYFNDFQIKKFYDKSEPKQWK